MQHKIDTHPIPEEVFYVNELSLAGKVPYETVQDMEEAATGKRVMDGGILPDDNVRIYVPMDLNADAIMSQLHLLFSSHGYPTESNESAYSSGVGKIITQLEIYDQVWSARDVGVKETGGVCHSRQGIELAGKIVKFLEDHEGNAECFPYDEIEELKNEFWL